MKRMRRLIPPLALILNACHPFKHNKPCDNCRQHIPTDENVRGPTPPHVRSNQTTILHSILSNCRSVWKVVATCLSLRALRNPSQCVLPVQHHKALALI